jgi:hypothetical protein
VEWGANVTGVSLSLIDELSERTLLQSERRVPSDDWIELLVSRPSSQLVRNLRTRWALLSVGDIVLPTTINEAEYDNSYVCSPYTGCVLYPQSEVKKIQGYCVRWAVLALVHAMSLPLRAAQINRVVCVNNWLLSTNLYADFDMGCASDLLKLLKCNFPSHAIAFRSLNEVSNPALMERLVTEGFVFVPSRQVYIFDGKSGEYMRRPKIDALTAMHRYRAVRSRTA